MTTNDPIFEPTWESLKQYTIPQWYQDAKFGIFIHWGLYSVAAYANEWYSRNMYLPGDPAFEHHRAVWGDQREFGYKDFIPLLTAANYDPAAWADLFKRAGAKYIVPVAEHHDGFCMYDSALTRWTAAKMGPKRDLIGELAAAVRGAGLTFGLSSHRAEHWWFMNGGRQFPSDVQDPAYADFYGPATPAPRDWNDPAWHTTDWQPRPHALYLDDWYARCTELVEKYEPQLVYFDWWIEQAVFSPYLQRFAANYYNRAQESGRGVVINYKQRGFPEGAAVFDIERGQLTEIRPQFWQTCTSVAKNSWGYTEQQDYKSSVSILHDLIDIVSKNGTLLLNIGPRADGTIPEAEQAILLDIGRWLAVNGEAIYGTRPWKTFGEGPTEVPKGAFQDADRAPFTACDVRFTTKSDTLYAVALGMPDDGEIVIRALAAGDPTPISRVELLGSDAPLDWSRADDGLRVHLPPNLPPSPALAFKIE